MTTLTEIETLTELLKAEGPARSTVADGPRDAYRGACNYLAWGGQP